ncbi:MAG: zf-TFIIB domain-containing protein [Bacillota bacterium]|nr:zf-TFIIB domain-containing protein [Bacillota bacterium]
MNCPVCDGIKMREVEKEGVLIDICPQCKGVWLDRGELDKLMSDVREISPDFNQWHQERYKDRSQDYYSSSYNDHHYKKKRKKNLLEKIGDIFD